jgi:hypothetical protein
MLVVLVALYRSLARSYRAIPVSPAPIPVA